MANTHRATKTRAKAFILEPPSQTNFYFLYHWRCDHDLFTLPIANPVPGRLRCKELKDSGLLKILGGERKQKKGSHKNSPIVSRLDVYLFEFKGVQDRKECGRKERMWHPFSFCIRKSKETAHFLMGKGSTPATGIGTKDGNS